MSKHLLVGIVRGQHYEGDLSGVISVLRSHREAFLGLRLILLGGTEAHKRAAERRLGDLDAPSFHVWAPRGLRDPGEGLDERLADYLAHELFGRIDKPSEERPVGLLLPPGLQADDPLALAIMQVGHRQPFVELWTEAGPVTRHIGLEQAASQMLTRPSVASEELIGGSVVMERLHREIGRAAATPFPVLIIGETGVGKELVASAIHRASARGDRRMVKVNAARLPDDAVADSEIFGHTGTAYTGAKGAREGRILEAEGSSLFLDELTFLSPVVQGKLLRATNQVNQAVLERIPFGGEEKDAKRCEVRLLTAAQHDPRFDSGLPGTHVMRDDLYHRLAIHIIRVPPLRDRGDDVLEIAEHLLARQRPIHGKNARLGPDCAAFLRGQRWPGNVRELRNLLLRAWLLALDDDGTIGTAHLEACVDSPPEAAATSVSPPTFELERAVAEFKVATIEAAIKLCGGNVTQAGKLLGYSQSAHNLRKKLESERCKLR